MGIADLFSDNNEKEAAGVVDKGYKKGFKDAKKNLNKGFKGLKKDYARGLSSIEKGAETARDDLTYGRDEGVGALTEGRDAALSYYDPFVESTAGAAGMYSDAIGLGGADGNARAEEAFQVTPGYEFRVNQGLNAIDRRAASRGMLASGNTAIDTLDYAGGLASQEYGTWLDRLAGQQEFGANIAGQRAGLQTGTAAGLAGLYSGTGTGLAGVATNAATQRAAVQTGRGDVKMGLGERMADLSYATRLGRAGVQGDYLAGKDGSAANAIGAITGGASIGAKLLGAG